MTNKLLYIHGYGSTGQAYKAQLLAQMFPQHTVVAPTFDYDTLSPDQMFDQLRAIVAQERPILVMGSSMGGYYALCTSAFYSGPIWCINPVHDILKVIRFLATQQADPTAASQLEQGLQLYADFDRRVFQSLQPRDGQLHLALSTDDEVLGSHLPLLDRFPNAQQVIWKDRCGHRFLRFEELKTDIGESVMI